MRDERLQEVKSYINQFCEYFLSKDIEKECNKLIKHLIKKYGFSMKKGKIEGWGAGIIFTICENSGLFDGNIMNQYGSYTYISRAEFSRVIGVSMTTLKSRQKYINSLLDGKTKFKVKNKQNLRCMDEDEIFETETEKNIRINFEKSRNAKTLEEAIKYMELTVEYAKKEIRDFEESKGFFWVIHETRPYMCSKLALAELYFANDQLDDAIKEFKQMLELNPMDNQGIRYKLINFLILANDKEYIEYMIKEFEDETASMMYPVALYYFYKKDTLNAKRYIKKALDANIYVPEILIGLLEGDEDVRLSYMLGSVEEAQVYFDEGGMVWLSIDGSLEWVFDEYLKYGDKNDVGIELSDEVLSEIRDGLSFLHKSWRDICSDIFKIS